MSVRTRFAPSPTGYLHIGGARTALFNWLFARSHPGGEFILRIEDTDEARSTDESTKAILDGMNWLGLDYDEGPFYQSDRYKLYREHAYWLVDNGHAYRCFCTGEELKERREEAMKEGRSPRYDGRCKDRLNARFGYAHTIRFKVPPGKTVFKDLVKGSIAVDHEEIDDFIILRSNDTPTYNLCVVIDDATMGLSHIIRGDDHIANTPKQILLYEALEYNVPEFAHVPMILGSDKARLSKRHGATSVMAYRDMGYLPEAIVNYLARLGWSHGDEEIFSLSELVEKFTLESVGKSSGVFNPEKLLWLNQHYIKESSDERLAELLVFYLGELGVEASGDKRLPEIVRGLRERSKTMVEMAEGALFFFLDVTEYDEKASRKFLTSKQAGPLTSIRDGLEALDPFNEEGIEAVFTRLMEETELKLGKLAQPVRVALTGTTISPGIFETIATLGKETTVLRISRALELIAAKPAEPTE